MTKQEEIFFDRVALAMQANPELSIEQGCRAVLNADIRILNTYSRLSDEKQREMQRFFSDLIWQKLQA